MGSKVIQVKEDDLQEKHKVSLDEKKFKNYLNKFFIQQLYS